MVISDRVHPVKWIIVALLLLLPAAGSADTRDPFEGVNRKTQKFNDFADRRLVRPLARGYRRVMPDPLEYIVGNFYGNLLDIGDGVNNLLQGKPASALSDAGRVLINTTLGMGGLFDPASRMGLVDHDEDFSQTLAVWGLPRGPYVVIPLLGPSSVRDVFGRSVEARLDPLRYHEPVDHRNGAYGHRLLHQRSELLAADKVVFGDRYIFFRDAFLQRREYLEQDGEVEDPFGDDF